MTTPELDSRPPPDPGLILLTGGSGFVGARVLAEARQRRLPLRLALRNAPKEAAPGDGIERFANLSLEHGAGWDQAIAGCDTIIHCAGLAHQPAGVDEKAMYAINSQATSMLTGLARKHGVRRFIHISSIRAVCGATFAEPVCEETLPAPTDVYGRSKRLGEEMALESGVQGAILRMPLVIGSQARANFGRLLKLAQSGYPLPLAGLHAPRSMLGAGTLADAVLALARMPPQPMQTMLIAEKEPAGIPELITMMRQSLQRPAKLFWLPDPLLKAAVTTLLSAQAWESVARPLVLKPTRLAALGWQPPHSLAEVVRNIMQGRE